MENRNHYFKNSFQRWKEKESHQRVKILVRKFYLLPYRNIFGASVYCKKVGITSLVTSSSFTLSRHFEYPSFSLRLDLPASKKMNRGKKNGSAYESLKNREIIFGSVFTTTNKKRKLFDFEPQESPDDCSALTHFIF